MSLFLLVLLALPGPVRAQADPDQSVPPPAAEAPASPDAPRMTPQQAQMVLDVLNDPQRRAEFTATLESITHLHPSPVTAPVAAPLAAPAPAPAAAPTPAPVPAAPAAARPAAAPGAAAGTINPVLPLAPGSLGAQVVGQASGWAAHLSHEWSSTVHAVGDLPLLARWIDRLSADPVLRDRALDLLWRLAAIGGGGAIVFLLLRWALRRPLDAIATQTERVGGPDIEPPAMAGEAPHAAKHRLHLTRAWRLMRKLPGILLRAALDLLPVLGFWLVGHMLLDTVLGGDTAARLAIVQVVDAGGVLGCIMVLVRLLFLPSHARARLLRVEDDTAAYVERWVRRIAAVVVFGLAIVQIAFPLGLNHAAQDELFKLIMLVAHLMLVVVVIQCRHKVARRIRARRGRQGPIAVVLNRLADVWHWIAIFYIMASWVVWAAELRNGFARLMHFFFVSAGVLIGARLVAILVLGGLYRALHVSPDTASRYPGLEARAGRYFPLVRGAVTMLILIGTLIALLQVWGFSALGWLTRGAIGLRLISALSSVGVTVVIAIVIWEAANAAMDRQVARLTADQHLARAARLRTLMPILQTTLLIAMLVIIGLTVLSEIGVNIAPLLAGAGIVGVALGFGSQKLVQDLITGLFLLLENAMQVGDAVTAAGLSGTVEHLSIRTLRLRAGDGSVHIIPFSAVTTMTNTNRGVGNAAVSVMVDGREDPDRVGDALKSIAAEMRADPAYAALMTSDLQLWGVDKVDGATTTLAGQIVCTDAGRWGVQREFNRRVWKRFQELGIRMAPAAQAVMILGNGPRRNSGPNGPAAAPTDAADPADIESPPPTALGHDH